MPIRRQLLLPSIDDYLGPGRTRFFARGYQRAVYRVRDIEAGPADGPEPGAHAVVDVDYPANWSRKDDDGDLRPHLSTIDALVLGVQLAQLHLTHAHRLSVSAQRRMRLRKVVLRAGGEPQEDLRDIPLSARPVRSEPPVPGAPRRRLSTYDCVVGSLRLRCGIEHDISDRETGTRRYASFDEALGPAEQRFYGDGFKARRHAIGNVRVDMDALTARADVHFPADGAGPYTGDGIDGALQPSVSLVDAFVVSLQLAQVLMYELDAVPRAASNTLWMMRTVLEAAAVPRSLPSHPQAPLVAETALASKRLLPLRGGIWRSVEIDGNFAGISLRSSFAHELPAEAAAHAVG
ncbi:MULTISPECIES: AvrD family protein [unclassified Streptomyces]|uniref:AvrD family protein n=1 Tax=unclassified Streptomyces TaxID=2593676 RepID=UPI002E2B0B26|nr:AvrD family protein [Streptomyces sp. NBC_00223]